MRTNERSWWWVKEKKQMALVFIAVTMILQFQMKGCVGCLETERVGLLQLKSYLISLPNPEEERSILKSWSDDDPKSDCCHWESLNCSDTIGGHIVDLSLYGTLKQWEGRKDLDLGRLAFNLSLLHSFPKLKTLHLSLNRFTHLFDPIHGYKSFQRLKNLETLDLSYNYFNNSVLPFLSEARSLRTINLEVNRLEGVFPPNELANMPKLRVLDLWSNEFNVFSVQGLINFRELEELDLSWNRIEDIEAGDGLRTTKLKTLDISGNNFSSTARLKGLKHLVELEVLSLTYNNFNDTQSIEGLEFPISLQVLNLRYNELSLNDKGYSKICGLMNLRELDLSNNALTMMPNCLGNLSRLRTLELSNNQLNEDLSSFVAGLPSTLEYLSLLHNNFNGSFLFNSLVNQTKLTVFRLSSDIGMIQAQAESSWVPPFQLKILKLQNFIFGSTFPGFLVHQHDLYYVDLSHNKLTGGFPTWLVQNNTGLDTILLNSNSLTKLQLPRMVHGLQSLDISSNMIDGAIHEDIGVVFPKLRYMNFSSNQFHGTIPSSMGEMKSLEKLDVSSNYLSGQLPKTLLNSCYLLYFLKLSNNQLHGEIFPKHANFTGLLWLFFDGNNFSGSLGKGLLNSKGLEVLDVSNNRFSGMIPLWMGRMSSLEYLYMRGNQLKGYFPHQLQSLSLTVLDISRNSFSGSIPRNLNFPFLEELRLGNNEFTGSISDTLFKAEELKVLDFQNNNFSGKIPNTIGKMSHLRVLLLGNNSLQSHIPKEICQLSEINLMDLSHNKFKGAIPSCLGNMSFGAERNDGLWLFDRRTFRDLVSQSWSYKSALDLGDYTYLKFIPAIVVDFLTKSRYESYHGGIVNNMYGLDLSSNELWGEIPVEIGNLHNIRSLNLSSNRLTGSIPSSISKLRDLESLDLSNNELDGNIPPMLADLNSLGYFNISCNNLSGEIPFKGHLITFDERSYIGNAHLCGQPTNKTCNPRSILEPSASKQAKEEEDDVIDMVWFYWASGAVYISTSLALFVFLCIDSHWSREWFYRVDLFIHHLQRFKRSSSCS